MTDPANDLFGEPPLMKGENSDRYFRLLEAVSDQIRPESFFDRLLVRELTDKIWEQQRSKQSIAALVDSAFIEALTSLIRPFIDPRALSIGDPAQKFAREYYSGTIDDAERKKLEQRLAQYEITPEQIRAKAMQICGPSILLFDRMGTNCATSLRLLRKENERRSLANANKGADNVPQTDEG